MIDVIALNLWFKGEEEDGGREGLGRRGGVSCGGMWFPNGENLLFDRFVCSAVGFREMWYVYGYAFFWGGGV